MFSSYWEQLHQCFTELSVCYVQMIENCEIE